jgi:hypothetical protein
LYIEGCTGFTTDASLYLRHYEKAEDAEEDTEQEKKDGFDWAKYDKEYLEREAKKAQSSK